jgi:hypothetical protein
MTLPLPMLLLTINLQELMSSLHMNRESHQNEDLIVCRNKREYYDESHRKDTGHRRDPARVVECLYSTARH